VTVSRRRDALLALATLTLLLAISFATETTGRLSEPLPAVAGIIGTLLSELLLLRFRRRVRSLWGWRWVRFGAVGAVFLVTGVAMASGATFVLAVLAWGLVAYLSLLGGIAARERAAGDSR